MKAIGFYIFNVFNWLFSVLPLRFLYFLSDLIYPLAYYIIRYRRRIVAKNIKNSFPEKSSCELKVLEKKFYRHFIDLFFETVKIRNISEKELKKRIQYKNLELLEEYFSKGKSVITILGHYGNWEWHVGFPLHSPHAPLASFLPLNNRYFNTWMIKLRRKFGAKLVPSTEVIKTVFELQKKRELFNCAFVADQSPQKGHTQFWTEFLNQETPVFIGPEKIARKFNFPVVYMRMSKLRRGYYEVDVVELCEHSSECAEFEITERHVRELENQIKQKPEFWLWTHRRWKFSKEDWLSYNSQSKNAIVS